MTTTKKDYKVYFGINNSSQSAERNNQNSIPTANVTIVENFDFYDYNSGSTIEYLKEYFLTTFGRKYEKYKICKCVLFVYYQENKRTFLSLSNNEKKRLSEFDRNKLFLIKINDYCECEYQMYKDYMNKSKFDLIAEIKQNSSFKEKYENLEKELKKLKKLDELNDYKKKIKLEEFYDIVININSIKNVNKEGWKVKFNQNGLEKYNKHKNKDLITIGVIGNNNKGKSFLLSRISKIPLLSGTSIETEGLSVKYPELEGYKGRQIILLDSAGLETPVLKKDINQNESQNKKIEEDKKLEEDKNEIKEEKEEKKELKENNIENEIKETEFLKENQNEFDKEIDQNKDFKERATDKIMTELFLKNFITEVCDILLVVVGKLTYSEQLLINKIKVESKKQNKGRIFIIHNLQEFREKEQVESYIKDTLLNCSTFSLTKRTKITTNKDEIVDSEVEKSSRLNDVHFTEMIKYGDKKLDIFHLILANEDSEAGKIYNKYSYDFIESIYNLISEPKKFDVFEKVKASFRKTSKIILNEKIEKLIFTENEKILKDKIIKLESKEDLSLKKCYMDELGFALFKSPDLELKYNYFKADENTLEIRVEVPGNSNCVVLHTVEGEYTIISIKGKKRNDKQPAEPKHNIFNLREFGEYEINVPLKIEDYKITQTKPKEGYPKFKNGLWIIQFELATKAEKVEIDNEDEV